MAKTKTPSGVEATGSFFDKKLIENCPLVITTIDCRPKDKKTYEFDEKIPGNPKDTDAFFLKDVHICDYYLESLGLPEIGGKGLYAA